MRPKAPPEAAGARRAVTGLSLLVVLLIGTTILPWQRVVATSSAPAPVRVATASVGTMQAALSLSGELRPTDQLDVAARTGARVTRVLVTVGQGVEAGQALAELDRTQLDVAVAKARSTLAKEQAALTKLQAAPRELEIAKEQASLRAAEATMEQLMQGARPEEVASAEAAVRAAEARLTQVSQGSATPQDVDIAVQRVNQARETRTKTTSGLALAKEQARLALDQAALSLRAAQATFGAAKLVYDEAVRTGKDPNVASCPKENRGCNDLSDIRLRQYKATYEAAEINLRAAEQAVVGRELAFEDAKQQEVAGLRIEASKVLDAQASLDKLRRGPEADDLAAAQADVEEARASLISLRAGPQADEVASAEADMAAARANLAKVQEPGVAADLEAARANVRNAEAELRLAEANANEATVVAPFAGIVTQRFVSTGSIVSSGTAVVQLASQAVEARVNADDSQIAFLEAGQSADLRLNAYPGVIFPARVEAISPTASTTSRTFAVTLGPASPDTRLKPGMLAQADVAAINRSDVLMVPEVAVVTRATDTAVFVVENGRVRRKTVQLGIRGGAMVEVIGGLSGGESVVVEGLTALNDNDQVTVVG